MAFRIEKLKTKHKNSALCLSEKLVSFYTLRFIHNTVSGNVKKMKKKDKELIADLKEYVTIAEERVKYSLERFDILIISLSSGGLVLALNLFKNYQNICVDKYFLKLSWLFFSLALIINLLSQVTGYLANKYDIKGAKNDILKLKKKDELQNIKWIDCYRNISDFLTKWLNILSFLSLTIGIILLVIFINFKA